VAGVDCEAKPMGGLLTQGVEERERNLNRRTTFFAHQMAVTTCCQVVRGGAMPEVRMGHDSQTLQFVEVSVDGRHRHIGGAGLNFTCQLFGTEVLVTLEKDLDQPSPSGGGPSTVGAQEGHHVVDRFDLLGEPVLGVWTSADCPMLRLGCYH
jgi:hypothetical protein